MNEILDIEIILNKNKYPKIYNVSTSIIIMILLFIYISVVYNYQTYHITNGRYIDGTLELLVSLDDIQYITKEKEILIENKKYNYQVLSISNEIYIDEKYNNYKYIYLEVANLNNYNNYVYKLKFPKENKKIIKYLKDYL